MEGKNKIRLRTERVYELLFLIVLILVIYIPVSPLNLPLTGRDSGLFMYLGSRILRGDLPYVHVWDHKPPLIFYINALGLFISGGSTWGIWFLEILSVFFAGFTSYYLFKKLFGSLPALFSTFLWLFSLNFLIKGGNITTEYTLPLQFASLWLLYDPDEIGFSGRKGYLIGILSALAFLLKQNTIGVGISIILFLIIDRLLVRAWKKLSLELLSILFGGLSVIIPVVAYLGLKSALPEFWDAAFKFNFAYTAPSLMDQFKAVVSGVNAISKTFLSPLGIVGWCFAVILLVYGNKITPKMKPVIIVGLINLPIELFFTSLTGKTYLHYYLTLLPGFSLFAAFLYWILINEFPTYKVRKTPAIFLTFYTLLIIVILNAERYYEQIVRYSNQTRSGTISYIQKVTEPDDHVLLWGAEAAINFYAERQSPTRFVYQYPLYQYNYADEDMIEEFLIDITENKPAIIIDTNNKKAPFLDFNIRSTEIDDMVSSIQSQYKFTDTIRGWDIYKYENNQ